MTAAAARELDEDLPHLLGACAAVGIDAVAVDWDDPAADWAGFDHAIVRSTWDYTVRLRAFIDFIERVGALCVLHNPPEILKWNTDKHYLADLAEVGVAVVPTDFVEPGDSVEFPASGEFVVKPTVSAGSRDTARYRAGRRAGAAAHVASLHAAGRSAMVQPYLPSVDSVGETALICFNGSVSHAITKAALLRVDAAPSRALFAPEKISPTAPAADEVAMADSVLDALGRLDHLGLGGRRPLYARVDLLRDEQGALRLLELELVEPSLFVDRSPGAAGRFAHAVSQLSGRRRGGC